MATVNVNSDVTDQFYRYKMPRIIAKVRKNYCWPASCKCEVIWENQAYGGTKITGSDMMPHIYFVTYEHLQKVFFFHSAQFKTIYKYKHMDKAGLGKHCLLPINRVFSDDVTNIEL